MPAGRSGAQGFRLAKQLVGGEITIIIGHEIRLDRRPLLQMPATATDAEVDVAGLLPVEKRVGLRLHDFTIVAIANGTCSDFSHHPP